MTLIFFLALIPSVVAGCCASRYGTKRIKRQSYVAAGLLGWVIVWLGGWLALCGGFASQTNDVEYWGGYATHAVYEEEWDEEVPCVHPHYVTETYTYSCGTPDNPQTCTGTREVQDGWEHLYDVADHPPRWYFEDSTGETTSIGPGDFDQLCHQFGNKHFVAMHRNFHSIDGNAYETDWTGTKATIFPVTREHTYTNRIQASRSLFRFEDVSPEDIKAYGLYEYPHPSDSGQMESVLGPCPMEVVKEVDWLNSTQGAAKQIHIWVLVFQNQPIDAGIKQESLWQGGNKNELVICIGTKARRVQWCYPFTWSEQEIVKVDAKRAVLTEAGKPFQGQALVAALPEIVAKEWKRKQFADFDYLSVDTPAWVFFLTFFLAIAVSAGVVVFAEKGSEGHRLGPLGR